MAKLRAKHPGAAIQVGHYGIATPEVPLEVPAEVAAEFAAAPDLEIVATEPEAVAPVRRKNKPAEPAEKE